MIRTTLPPELYDYYNDLDTVNWDMSKVEKLEEINFFLFKLTLYRLPDAFPVLGQENPIFVYTLTIGNKKRPTVLCTDILGGVMKWKEEEKRATANYPIAFINAIACVLFKRWNAFIVCTANKKMFTDGDTPEHFQESLENVAYNNIQATQFIKTLPTTDCNNISAIGVSLGALTMGAMYALDDSYKKVVVIIGGYSLDEIISTSEEGMVQGFYERMVALYGTEAKEVIKSAIQKSNDVYQYAPSKGVLQIKMTSGDVSVPSVTQDNYTNLINPDEVVKLKYSNFMAKLNFFKNGHYQTLLHYPYLIYRSLKFIAKE